MDDLENKSRSVTQLNAKSIQICCTQIFLNERSRKLAHLKMINPVDIAVVVVDPLSLLRLRSDNLLECEMDVSYPLACNRELSQRQETKLTWSCNNLVDE